MSIKIISVGGYLPAKTLTNHELPKELDTSHEWIIERTGIVSRHIAAEDENSSDIGYKAALDTLNKANVNPEDVDCIITATTTPDRYFPSCAANIQRLLGNKKAFVFDVGAACAGFVYALSLAESLMNTGKANNVLIIGTDTLTKFVDWNDRATCVLFGDGAGAMLLQNDNTLKESAIIATKLYSDGDKYDLILSHRSEINDHRGYLTMSGRAVYKYAIEYMYMAIEDILKESGLTLDDIDFVIPHQANKRIIDSMISMKKIPEEKVIISIQDHANTSSASIPLALKKCLESGKIKKGQKVLVTALGAGLVWGSAIIRI